MRYYCRIGSGTSGRGRPLFQFFNQASEQVLVYLYVSLDGSPICAEFRRRVVKRALSRNPFVQSRKKKSRPSYRLVYCFDGRHTALWLLHLPTKNCNQKATHFIGDRVALFNPCGHEIPIAYQNTFLDSSIHNADKIRLIIFSSEFT